MELADSKSEGREDVASLFGNTSVGEPNDEHQQQTRELLEIRDKYDVVMSIVYQN